MTAGLLRKLPRRQRKQYEKLQALDRAEGIRGGGGGGLLLIVQGMCETIVRVKI